MTLRCLLDTDLLIRLSVPPFDGAAAAQQRTDPRRSGAAGAAISPYDLMIAGPARSRGLVVVTGNLGEFAQAEGSRSEDWLAAS